MEHVDAYWEYHKVVGDEVGDKLLSPEEYENFKKNVVPERMKNRIFVSWRVEGGVDCELIGPESMCHCQHRYRQHKTDNVEKNTACKSCRCRKYEYAPRIGSQPTRCKCKHYSTDHDLKKACTKCNCKTMYLTFTCPCGQPAHRHATCFETKEERMASGKPVGKDVPYAAMGGLTGFSSLAPGYMRLDPSGSQGDTVFQSDSGALPGPSRQIEPESRALRGRYPK